MPEIEAPTGPPTPKDPIELGLTLRAARERLGYSLEEIRDRIAVPRVDLVALESGEISLLHTERAGAVALWRYAEILGLDAEALVRVVHEHWPRPTQGNLAIQPFSGIELPVFRINQAHHLLLPIAGASNRTARSRPLGLSTSMRAQLSSASARRNLGYQLLGPARPSRRKSARSLSSAPEYDETTPLAELAPPSLAEVEVASVTEGSHGLIDGATTSVAPPVEVTEHPAPTFDVAEALLDDVPGLSDAPFTLFDARASLTDVAGSSAEGDAADGELDGEEPAGGDLDDPETNVMEALAPTDPETIAVPIVSAATTTETFSETQTSPQAPLPSFPSAQTPATVTPASNRVRGARERVTRRLRLPGSRGGRVDASADDAALQRLLANVPADQHEALLRSAVDRLDPQEREVLRLVIWDELSHDAAAGRLGIGESELLDLLARARTAFRHELVELAGGDE